MTKPISKIQAKRAQIEAAIAWYIDNASRLETIAEEADKLGGDCDIDDTNLDLSIRIAGDRHKLVAMWRVLRAAGFSTDTKRPEKNATSWVGWWTHPLIKNGISYSVYFVFSSTACRRVKVGTRVVPERTEDVYETVCGEVEPYAPTPQAPGAPADQVDDIPF